MRSAALLAAAFSVCTAVGTTRADDNPEFPCRYLTTTNVTFSVNASTVYADSRVICYDEYTNETQGHFEAVAWVVDETVASIVGEDSCQRWCYQSRWVGSVGVISVPDHCYRSQVEASSSFYMQGAGSSQQCAPPEDEDGGGGDPPGRENIDPGGCVPLNGGCSPLILDLNGDGIHTTSIEDSPVLFDISGNGVMDVVAWTNPTTEEGILYFDHNHNGRIDGGKELFGNVTLLPDETPASNGFGALAAYDRPERDGNGDGVISPHDGVWGRLRIWIDRNHDGDMTSDENYSLGSLHVLEIHVTYVDMTGAPELATDSSGNRHLQQGTFVRRITGQGRQNAVVTRAVHDVWFVADLR